MKKKYQILQKINSAVIKFCLLAVIGIFFTTKSYSQTYATVPFNDGFETGSLGPSWSETSSLGDPASNTVIQTGSLTWGGATAFSNTGNYFLGMHYPAPGGAYNLNQVNLHMDLAGESNIRLSFWWAEWNDETEIEDGVFVSDDNGVNFVQVLEYDSFSQTDLVYTHFDMSIDSINAVHGLTMSPQYIIRFQQYDNYYFAGGNDGHLYDDVSVYSAVCIPTSSTDIQTACDSYTWIDGNTYTASTNNPAPTVHTINAGSYYYLPSSLTINAGDIVEWINDGGTHNVNGDINTITSMSYNNPEVFSSPSTNVTGAVIYSHTFTIPGTYNYDCSVGQHAANGMTGMLTVLPPPPTHTIMNAAGCDSVITLDLTINYSNTGTDIITACDNYTWIDSNTYTVSNNTATYTIPNAAGCDSIITLDLTVNSSTQSSVTAQGLDSYTAPSGTVYTSGGVYTDIIQNAAGCDSIITIDLSMNFTGIDELNTTSKQLIKIVDVLGRETPFKLNTPLLYIYDDGTIERKVVLK